MAWTLTFADTDVVAGESSELTVRKDGKELLGGDLAAEGASLELTLPTGVPADAATLTGRYVKVPFPPRTQEVRVDVLVADEKGNARSVAHAEAGVILPWRLDAGPKLVDAVPGIANTISWDDDVGRRAKLVLHDVLEQLPADFVRVLDDLPIVRLDPQAVTGAGGEYVIGIKAVEHVFLTDATVKMLQAPAAAQSPTVTAEDRAFAAYLVHELCHAWITRRCGGGLGNGARFVADVAQVLVGGLVVQGASLVGLFCPPVLLFAVELGAGATLAHTLASQDAMSEFCTASGWRHRALSALSVPLFGLLGFYLLEQPPNCVTALLTQADYADLPLELNTRTLNVRNTEFDVTQVHQVASSDPPLKYFDKPDEVHKLLDADPAKDGAYARGPASVYGAMSPMEDLSEAATALALQIRGTFPDKPGIPAGGRAHKPAERFLQPNQRQRANWSNGPYYRAPSASRAKYFTALGLFTEDVVVGAGDTITQLGGFPVPLVKSRGSWRVQALGVSEEAEAKAREEHEAIANAHAAIKEWNAGPARELAVAEAAVAQLGAPHPDGERVHTFFAQLECHGDGLGALDPATGAGAEGGDVVLAADAAVRVVHRADAGGIRTLIAGPDELQSRPSKELPLAELDLRLRWPPDAKPRVFCPSGEHGAAYGDVEASLRRLIGLWGAEKHAGEELGSLSGFAATLASELALPDAPAVDVERTGALDVLARLNGLGAGLRPYDPDAPDAPVLVGDVVVLFDGNTLGVVTRLDGDGRPQDVLLGGSTADGALAEAAGTPRMLHDIDPLDVRHVWRPDPTPRSFPMPETSATTLTDPARSLRHALAHQGARWLVRREEHVTLNDPLGVLAGLLVEGEPDAKVRRGLGIGVRSSDREVLEALAAHGEVRARGAVSAGDVVVLDDDTRGLVLEAGDGAITQLLTEIDHVLDVHEAPITAARVVLAWTPSHAPREVALPEGVAGFYGGDASALLALPARIGTALDFAVGLDGERVDAMPQSADGLARIFAAAAPAWVRRRLWGADDVKTLKLRCDTLGAGLVDPARGGLPVGTWLFDQDGLNIVLAVDAEGFPALVYAAGGNGGGTLYPYPGRPDGQAWVPAVTPRAYTSADGAGYADRNVLVGMLHVWGAHRYELSTPLFADPDLPRSGAFSAPAERVLSRGPDSAGDWPEYLAEHGTVADGPGAPGDLLLFADPEKQAILLDDDTMLVQPGPHKALAVRKPAGVTGHWKPAG